MRHDNAPFDLERGGWDLHYKNDKDKKFVKSFFTMLGLFIIFTFTKLL